MILDNPHQNRRTARDDRGAVNQLGNTAKASDRAEPEEQTELYSSLRPSLTYHHVQIVEVEVASWPTVWIATVSEAGHAP